MPKASTKRRRNDAREAHGECPETRTCEPEDVYQGRHSQQRRRPLHDLRGRALRRRVAWMWRHRPILEYWCDGYGGLEWIQEIPNGYGGGETRFHIRTPRQVRSAARKARLK